MHGYICMHILSISGHKGKSSPPREVNTLLTGSSSLTNASYLRRFRDSEAASARHLVAQMCYSTCNFS